MKEKTAANSTEETQSETTNSSNSSTNQIGSDTHVSGYYSPNLALLGTEPLENTFLTNEVLVLTKTAHL